MDEITPLPSHGSVFFDERDQGRSLRLSYHSENANFVISLWRIDTCLGTFRLSADEAPRFIYELTSSLAAEIDSSATSELNPAAGRSESA